MIGPFRFDRRARVLTRDGVRVTLGGRALEVLLVLSETAGVTVTKDVLLSKAWRGLIVEENNLYVQISALRKAIGDRWIVTVPGTGYRLHASRENSHLSRPSADGEKPSIAVLPFENTSANPDEEYFADGIAEEILTALSRNRMLFVVARNSSFSFKGRIIDVRDIGRDLAVRYVIGGSVRRGGGRIRVAAQLIDAETGRHIWVDRFDGDLDDTFALQDDITRAILEALGPAVAQAERQRALRRRPEQLGAWEAYQRGLWYWARQGPTNMDVAREFLCQAAALDPTFSQPHAALAWLYLSESTRDGDVLPGEGVRKAETAARIAISLDPDNSTGHAALGLALDHQGAMEAALAEAEIAVELNPNDPWAQMAKGRILVFSGHAAEGSEPLSITSRLDPHGMTAMVADHHLGVGHYFSMNFVASVDVMRRLTRMHPKFPRAYPVLAAALGQLSLIDEARATLDAATSTSLTYFDTLTRSRPRYYRPMDYELLLNGLRKAGWQG